ncbi:2-amino-3,7-dideoxy-D-threo-hept-6-ulosonate synthase [Mycolicibacterium mengxianglii]|uniref:2-amino-3,7-dideoxy-D-threo-hept-6-ulosonate synthase n=1 Tax=Mycolicibacterium mengxianglii TaxID=2736649 RepID=UPI0018D0490F|nr:2-amino-3,7-dideoxy-D-threo-hept-6-ulosonate synthase [Mycolicibacterium mengxianglii]
MFEDRGWQQRGSTGTRIRLSRIFDPGSHRALVVPMDHSVTIGPLGGADHADRTARLLAAAGADAIVVHKGRARAIDPAHFTNMALIVHLSAGTDISIDRTSKVLVGSVEDCLRLGADAVSVHVNVGSPTESTQLADLGAVASACDTLGMPLLAMMYARGPEVGSHTDLVDTLSHLGAIATDLGATMVKLDYAGSVTAMNHVADSCPLPILVAGGVAAATDDAAITYAAEVAETRVAGLSFGRLIFDADSPHRVTSEIARRLHRRPLASALESASA